MPTPLFKPTIRRRSLDNVLSCLVSDELGHGRLARELTRGAARLVGAAGGIGVADEARGLLVALDALETDPSTAVVVSALTPRSTVVVLARGGFRPVVVDVDPVTANPSIETIRAGLGDEIDGAVLLLGHSGGHLVDPLPFMELGLRVIEVAGETFAIPVGDRRSGACGDIGIVALGPRSMITAASGALVLARERPVLKRTEAAADELPAGSNLSDLNAALASAQLDELESLLARRRTIGASFLQAVGKTRHRLLSLVGDVEAGAQAYTCTVVIEDGIGEVQRYARKAGIETALAFSDAIVTAATESTVDGEQEKPGAEKRESERDDNVAIHAASGAPAARQTADGSPAASDGTPSAPRAGGYETLGSDRKAASFGAEQCLVARRLAGRCLQFPLYPSLPSDSIKSIARLLTTLP